MRIFGLGIPELIIVLLLLVPLVAVVVLVVFVLSKGSSKQQQPPQPPSAAASTGIPTSDSVELLKEYKGLLDMGVLTQGEYDAKKKELLGL